MNELQPFEQRFIVHWGEMGSRWGINRTVAQIHALLYLSPHPLNAEQISSLLSVARSNVSTSLRELASWGLARTSHVLGNRRDYFETEKDVAELFRRILEERKRREFDPTAAVLRECLQEAEQDGFGQSPSSQAIQSLSHFLDDLDDLYQHVQSLPSTALLRLVRLGKKLKQLLGG